MRRRDFEQPRLVGPIRRQERKRVDGILRREEIRYAARFERVVHFAPIDRAEPRGEHRLPVVARDIRERMRGLHCAGVGTGHVQRDDDVDVGIVERDCHGRGVAFGRRIAHVDRIRVRRVVREQRVELRGGFTRERGERDAVLRCAVRREQRRTPTVRDDREPLTARYPAARQDPGGGKKLRIGLDADGAGARKRRVEHCVRRDIGRRLERAPCLQHDDGLRARGGAQRGHECPRVARFLDIEQDAVGDGILQQQVEQLAEADVDAAAERDHVRKSDPERHREIEHRGGHRARLRDEREMAGHRHRCAIRRVDARFGTDHAERSGADDAHARAPRRGRHVIRPRTHRLRIDAGGRGHDDCHLHARLARRREHL